MATCALCKKDTDEVGPLQQSHIIPRLFLQKTKIEGRGLHYNARDKSFAVAQVDWKEYLLCTNCEKTLKGHEDLLQEVLYLRRKTAWQQIGRRRLRLKIAANDVALALITILWRASISTVEPFRTFSMSAALNETIRGWIITGNLSHLWHIHVSIDIQQIVFQGHKQTLFVSPVLRDRPLGHIGGDCLFFFGGYFVKFMIPTPRQTVGLRRLQPGSQAVDIRSIELMDIPELNDIHTEMLFTPMSTKVKQQVEENAKRKRK